MSLTKNRGAGAINVSIDFPRRYRKIPKDVEAMLIVDYTSMKKAVGWVESNGGFAKITNMFTQGSEKLVVETSLGLVEVPRQYFLIKGDLGGFYSYPANIFNQEYTLMEDND